MRRTTVIWLQFLSKIYPKYFLTDKYSGCCFQKVDTHR